MKVVCAPATVLSSLKSKLYFSFFERSSAEGSGTIALDWPRRLSRAGYRPSVEAWDLTLVFLAASAADFNCLRRTSADGWTRDIELAVAVNEPEKWTELAPILTRLLRLLTGDVWTVAFLPNGTKPPVAKQQTLCDRDCVSLLSGGLDSLIGGIDLVADGATPLFVSQIVPADRLRQQNYARALNGAAWHQQWNHSIRITGENEPSTRARSLVFYAQAILSSERIGKSPVDVYVPENGFISVNPPLTLGRLGSYSTRTTHPRVMEMLQSLVDALAIPVRLVFPYRFKTKGEMLADCKNQALLRTMAYNTTSCGRFLRHKRTHCGVCVPCLVRKAAFHAWSPGVDDTRYESGNLKAGAKDRGPDDVQAMVLAVERYRNEGVSRFLGPAVSFATPQERAAYEGVIGRALDEMEKFLTHAGVL